MADITLNCTKCGAPVPYDGSDVKTIQCPFCNSTIIVPVDLRPRKIPTVSMRQYTPAQVDQVEAPTSNRAGVIAVTVLVGVLIFVGALIAILAFSSGNSESDCRGSHSDSDRGYSSDGYPRAVPDACL